MDKNRHDFKEDDDEQLLDDLPIAKVNQHIAHYYS